MDDDQVVREFSFELVNDYFLQAIENFSKLDSALKAKNLDSLRSIGHFLKGSSSGIGLKQLQETFGKIDNLGKGCDEGGRDSNDSPEVRLKQIAALIVQAKSQYNAVSKPVQHFYGEDRFSKAVRETIPLQP